MDISDGKILRLAIAMGENEELFGDHFGHTKRFLLLDFNGETFHQVAEVANRKALEESNHVTKEGDSHNHEGYGHGVGKLLGEHHVQVIVSKAFGPNIKRMRQHFAPVLVRCDTLAEAKAALIEHWLEVVAIWEKGAERHHLVIRNLTQ